LVSQNSGFANEFEEFQGKLELSTQIRLVMYELHQKE